jgi:hypothetical protein
VPDIITATINAPSMAQTWHPGDALPERFVSDTQEYPCQVLHLSRVLGDDSRKLSKIASLPDPSRVVDMQNIFKDFESYAVCRQSVQDIQQYLESNPTCESELEPLVSANSSILPPSQKVMDSCSSRCLAKVTRKMNQTHALCVDSWHLFVSSPAAGDAELKASIRVKFLFAVLYVSEFFFRSTIACRGNYKRKMCNDVLENLPAIIDATCRDRYEAFNSSTAVLAVQLLQLDMTKQNDGICKMNCRVGSESFLVQGHCCLATIHEAQGHWVASVIPSGENQIEFDASLYLAEFGSAQLPTQTERMVTIRRPSGTCPLRTNHSLACALDACGFGNLWPAPCCAPMDCKNGGTIDYTGVCYCRCVVPYAGFDCAQARNQVLTLTSHCTNTP